MFRSAILRLTLWYMAILMAISFAFSLWIYSAASNELRLGLQRQVVRIEKPYYEAPLPDSTVQQIVDEQLEAAQQRLVFDLVVFNICVLALGGVGSYLLARRTLRPIQESLEAQHRFTADASHELRTPLAAMKTEIEVALRDPNLKKAEMHELLQSNLEEVNRLTKLAGDLLLLAERETKPELEAVRMDEAVRQVRKRLSSLAKAKNITLTTGLSAAVIKAQPDELQKVIGILLDNAIKYSPENTTISTHIFAKGNQAILQIVDQGRGIAAESLPHIFERFYRVDSSRTQEKISGYGLGLSIAHKLVASFGGTIEATSAVGQGTTFTLRFPLITPGSNKT